MEERSDGEEGVSEATVRAVGGEAHIEVRNVTLAYGETVIQRDLDFTIKRGDVFVIMGGSGCGKSTLLRLLIGLKSPARGHILYEGEDFWAADEDARAECMRRFGVMYQGGALWSAMTLAENIALPLETYADLDPAVVRDAVEWKLALVGLAGYEDYYPSEISGGMRKRAALARAMALDPEILFFDEPSAGLDPISSRRLDELILELRDSLGSAVVIVTHELDSIFTIADDSVLLDRGARTAIAFGNPRTLRDSSGDARVTSFLRRGESSEGQELS